MFESSESAETPEPIPPGESSLPGVTIPPEDSPDAATPDGDAGASTPADEQPLGRLQRLSRHALEATARRRRAPRAETLVEPYSWLGDTGLDPRKARTRASLARAFVDLVADSDVAGLSVAAVAGRAGLSRQTARSNIAGITDLALAAVADRLRLHLAERVGEEVAPTADAMAETVLEHGITPLLGAIDDDRLLFQRLHAVPAFDRIGELLADLFRDWTIRQIKDSGVEPGDACDDAVNFAVQGMVGLLSTWLASPAAPVPEEQAERLRMLVGATASTQLPPTRTARVQLAERKAPVHHEGLPGDDLTLGLALGGGGALGAAHVGVLKALVERGIQPGLVAGTSVGSIIGAVWAAGRPIDEIEERLLEWGWSTFGRLRPSRFGLLDSSVVVTSMGGLQDVRIEDLPRAYAAVATDVRGRAEVVIQEGPLSRAVRASMAVPGVFHPIVEGDRILMDGGMAANLPIGAARWLGAERVIAVRLRPEWDLLEVANVTGDPRELEREDSVLVIKPDLAGLSEWSKSDVAHSIDIGYRAGVAALDAGWPIKATSASA